MGFLRSHHKFIDYFGMQRNWQEIYPTQTLHILETSTGVKTATSLGKCLWMRLWIIKWTFNFTHYGVHGQAKQVEI